jgi:glucoamylase
MSGTVAPGAPGNPAAWTSSAKSGIGTALSPACSVWFTLSHGILNEVYYPRVDRACTRDLGLLVCGPDGYVSEEKRDAVSVIAPFEDGVPAYRLTNTALDGAYRIEKRVLGDPHRPTVLQEIRFMPLAGVIEDYRVYALLAPHLVNAGMGNTAWVGDYKGTRVLQATGTGGVSLALACSLGWPSASAGFVGHSDGWRLLHDAGRLEPAYERAENGNVALTGEIGFSAEHSTALLALGFGPGPQEAAYNAVASLMAGFDLAERDYVRGWRAWQRKLVELDRTVPSGLNTYRISTAVLAAHRPLAFPGPAVASLSIPWGFSKGDEDLGGYHLVWPRDLVETAGGQLAAGSVAAAKAVLDYLAAIQEADGHWVQNAWLDGTAYWDGIQMDECAFPILLAEALHRAGRLPPALLLSYLPMIEHAAAFLVDNGPVTGEDRWEEDAGYSPFTLAVEIAALLAAADLLDVCDRTGAATYLRETADTWNDQVERWTFASDTELSRKLGVAGFYVRIAPPEVADAASPKGGFVPIKNRPPEETDQPAQQIVSPDALALVRFGLRAADDPRILDTVKAIDAGLKCELPQGPVWYRYTGDGYGEHPDGRPFDGTGQGRPWPLLTGERAHYELAAGNRAGALALLETLEASAGTGGLIPEQVWDQADIAERELIRGRPSGSAMPLVWAHSEHIKLLRSLRDGSVFDLPPQGVERYIKRKTVSPNRIWRFNNKIRTMPAGKTLRIELPAAARIHWSGDGWATKQDVKCLRNELGFHFADLRTASFAAGKEIVFTFFWPDAARWENVDFSVRVVSDDATVPA